ncbi:MAG: sigma-70 family RNA polymerase sigma factor [Candidatus Eisenbacteria bacterium]|nr:sigma-70 family RNA polymerase sigma factor [Candidatus Eisenbacteria bacterium]
MLVPFERLDRGGGQALTDRRDVTELLCAVTSGDTAASERLATMVHEELRRLAQYQMSRERPGHTLQTTALAHDAYLRLIDQSRVEWQNRAHFFAVATEAIRRILIDHARARRAARRGGDSERLSFDDLTAAQRISAAGATNLNDEALLQVDLALERFTLADPIRARVVELRFYGGLTHQEIAEVMGVSLSSVERHWRFARAWLYRALAEGNEA